MIAFKGLDLAGLELGRPKQVPYHWNRNQQDAQYEDPQRNHLVCTENLKALQSKEGEQSAVIYSIRRLHGNPKKQIKWCGIRELPTAVKSQFKVDEPAAT